MDKDQGALSSAAIYVKAPVLYRLDGELVEFELQSGKDIFCGVMSIANFIESFRRAAQITHQWTSTHYGQDDIPPPAIEPQQSAARNAAQVRAAER